MSPGRVRLPSQSAALAGVPAGVQATGPWMGRRQLFVKFAAEAETATIYTAKALAGELERLARRARFHSVAIAGRDPLAEYDFLQTALDGRSLPVMLDHDGQRPTELEALLGHLDLGKLDLAQVSLDGTEGEGAMERVAACLAVAARGGVGHALTLVPAEGASDARLLRIVEQAHTASPAASVVLHLSTDSASQADLRWVEWLERAMNVHDDVRLVPMLPAPTGSR